MAHTDLLFVGGDARSAYAARFLEKRGYAVTIYDPFYAKFDKISNTKTIITSVPLSPDGNTINGINARLLTVKTLIPLITKDHLIIGGNFSKDFIDSIKNTGAKYHDLMHAPKYIYKNARLSAEGLLCKIIEDTPFSLERINILLLGYGHCGLYIANLLNELGAIVHVSDIDPKKSELARANGFKLFQDNEPNDSCLNFNIVINAITGDILSESFIRQLRPETFIFNFSSQKPVFKADSYIGRLKYFDCPSLPGKYVPESAGYAIGESIDDYLTNGGID